MQIPNHDALKIEPEIMAFWEKNRIYQKAKENAKGEKFYFLDGPPYTSGKVHIGTAWNKALKDMVLRFKRMNGFRVWDRAGYDMQGLPTEHKVEEKFGIKHKEEIPKFGVEKFVKECRKLSMENLVLMNADFKRLGVWMDFENAYKSIDNSFIEGEWWLIKKAHENKRLYEGEKVMHWCPHCATALAKHELEYKNIEDDSIFLKFPINDKKNEFLIIWTTTPWTIPYNLAVMVNPDVDYARAKVGDDVWIVAKPLVGVLIQGVANKNFEIIEQFKGRKLNGISYVHPLHDELKAVYEKIRKKSPKMHTVVLSKEYVDTSSGSGLVHCAPGCGPEDYEVGYKNKIIPFNNLDENGVFPKEMGIFKGFTARKDDKKFIGLFDKKGFLIASTPVEHEYAHCWRCHKGVVFRTTKQWFFKVENMKNQMKELNKKVYWVPEWAGSRQFDSWLDNLRDNGITRQRYWGCPAPIWRCSKCMEYVVVGSADELKKLSKQELPEDLHLPWIDAVKIPCKCGGVKKRIPDILDVWIDAGTTSWTCLDYPQRADLFKQLWPADFILEGKDQIRGWFNLLLVASMVSMKKHSYKAVYMHGWTNDLQGRKMSKSLGNYITPDEVVGKYGADAFRYYFIGGASPGEDINYNFEDLQLKHRNLFVLWNIHKFLIELCNELKESLEKFDNAVMMDEYSVEERYIISKLSNTIQNVTKLYHDYKLNEVPWKIEELFLELSRTYIQLVRDKAAIGTKEEKRVVMYVVYKVLLDCLVLFAPIVPFITESIYQNLRNVLRLKQESIHLLKWPSADRKHIDAKLENEMMIVGDVIQAILSAREKAQISLRWPLKEAVIASKDKNIVEAVEELEEIIKMQTNVKEIRVQESLPGVKEIVKADFAKIGPLFGAKSPKVIAQMSLHSAETILKHIEKEGKFRFSIDGEEVSVTKDCIAVSRIVPYPFVEAELKSGFAYINQEMSDELEAEGYAREVMRRIQAARKKAGLEKADRIVLHIKTKAEMVESLNKFKELISDKCGVSKLAISELGPAKKHEFASLEKVKDYSFEICFDKV